MLSGESQLKLDRGNNLVSNGISKIFRNTNGSAQKLSSVLGFEDEMVESCDFSYLCEVFNLI